MKRLLTRKNALLLLVAIIGLIYQTYFPSEPQPLKQQQTQAITTNAAHISPNRAKHILYGDHKGGGHRYGAGKPCKSEFPKGWNDEKILQTTARIAANDNLKWNQQRNGYHVTQQMIEGVNVKVVLGRDQKTIITAYPTNRPRNPCPANDG